MASITTSIPTPTGGDTGEDSGEDPVVVRVVIRADDDTNIPTGTKGSSCTSGNDVITDIS
jgi:hypothetical protein